MQDNLTELIGTIPAPVEFSKLNHTAFELIPKLKIARMEVENIESELEILHSQMTTITNLISEKLKARTSGKGIKLEYVPKTADFKVYIEPNTLIKEAQLSDKYKNINFDNLK